MNHRLGYSEKAKAIGLATCHWFSMTISSTACLQPAKSEF